MPEIPTTYARPNAVSAAGAAPQLGRALSIHALDVPYEANIRGLRDLAQTGKQVGRELNKISYDLADYLGKEKRKEDIASFSQAKDIYLENMSKFDEVSLAQAKDPETGEVDFARFGEDLEGQSSAYMADALGRVKANDEVRGMLQRWYRESYHGQKQKDIIAKRVGWQREKTNNYYESKINEAVANMDGGEAIAMATLQATNDGKLTAELPSRILQIKGNVWFNKQKEATKEDIHNYDPMKLKDEEIPPYFKDKDEVRRKLDYFRKTQIAYKKEEFAKYKAEKDNEIYGKLGTNELNDDYWKALKKEKGFDGQLYTNKEVSNLERIHNNILLKKEEKANDALVNNLRWEAGRLQLDDPQYTEKRRDILRRANESVPKRSDFNLIEGEFESAKKRTSAVSKMSEVQKKDRRGLFDTLEERFGVKGDEIPTLSAYEDKKKEAWSVTKGLRNFGIALPFGIGQDEIVTEPSQVLNAQAVSNIQKAFDEWASSKADWTMKEGQEKIKELSQPYAIKNYQKQILEYSKQPTEVERMVNGKIAIFNPETKKFIRWK